jgi:bifunctional non-homologous end joining protein LigD
MVKKNNRRGVEQVVLSPTCKPPAFITPMAAQFVKRLLEGDEWIYELKFDGYRALLLKDHQHVEIHSRKNRDLTTMYPRIAAATLRLNAEQVVVDGEIVALDQQGRPYIQALQHRGSHLGHHIAYYAFDLLHLDGADLTGQPLLKRRESLPEVLEGSGLLLSKELPGTPATIVEAVHKLGLEGVIARRKASLYVPGDRSEDWQKLKLENQQEFVIGGYRPGSNGVDALLVGYYDATGLRFASGNKKLQQFQ